ncbi:Holliday junction resolvase RuvX [bacterium]|jgi:putative holliday junction resolvase|nr:Holliday junction resolvase RuvX [bacterium]MBT4121616.1 Holliday junction resolvase RuvX [bacterium]MBT4335121.1 Holliday junction resolvase RuvX [bacterium]MBT4495282.1 Holliday junction resolvase RuvX [bacterium]MBT4763906.1 Holliday junction resolvase RuvX [bacterium]
MSKILGIDYGESKVGLAISDSDTKLAVPLEIIKNEELEDKIKYFIDKELVEKIVIGLPISLDGTDTEQTKVVREYISYLKENFKVEIIPQDERLSTKEASRTGHDDDVAAMYILQTYLDSKYG